MMLYIRRNKGIMDNLEKKGKLIYPKFFAGFSKDEENVEYSSSGGIFLELCKYAIMNNYVVYGAVQKSVLEVEHVRATTLEEAKRFRRSKYLKSRLQGCFIQVKEDLESGKCVLFSGVPCQIAALYRYLNNSYENLYTVEVVCHGIPYTSVFRKYVQERSKKYESQMTDICFRDKSQGWKNNSIREYYENGQEYVVSSAEHPVHSLYIRGINMEDRCGKCPYAKLPRVADLTLADFWQYQGELLEKNNDSGISLVVVNNNKGTMLWEHISDSVYYEQVNKESAVSSCYHLTHSPRLSKTKKAFFKTCEDASFSFAVELCTTFGDVILADELLQTTKKDVDYVFDILERDTQEIIYVTDEQDVLNGIVTFGAFVSAYMKGQEWVNYQFGKVVFSENCIEDIKEVFSRSEKILRVPVVDENGRLLFEVRRTVGGNGREDVRKGLITFIKLREKNIRCMFFKRPDYLSDFSYTDEQKEQIQNKWSFPVLCEDIEKSKHILKRIIGEKFSAEYVKELCKISPIIPKGERYVHVDSIQKKVNVIGGMRKTCYQPEKYVMSVHMYGRCGVFGYAVEDGETMPSYLQKELNEKNVRVLNHGIWGADNTKILTNLYCDFKENQIRTEDIVLFYMDYLPYMAELETIGVEIYDTTDIYHEFLTSGGTFYDRPGHMTAEGYQVIAKYIFQQLGDLSTKKIEKTRDVASKRIDINATKYENQDEIRDYLKKIKSMFSDVDFRNKKIGAIVMNCNPFTNGHKYLIETARKQVDVLMIFVLEEDKSYFSYEDRMAMVKLGTAEMDNVYVCPSGKFMISTLTFPEYFLKDQQQEVMINPAKDVEIFGTFIAPEFHITKRFVGTEPLDNVTNQYNQTLKEILPAYGIELIEIPRLKTDDIFISATQVRKYIQTKQYFKLEKLVPQTTMTYIRDMIER